MAEESYFVFGGDLFDRGPGDLRLASALLDLQGRHPDRVFLLLGNRDINKLRLPSELSQECLDRSADDCTRCIYNYAKGKGDASKDNHDLVSRVQWILKQTMGASKAFEFRREELRLLLTDDRPVSEATRVLAQQRKEMKQTVLDFPVTDEEVANNFYHEIMPPHGLVFKLLEASILAKQIGDTLFVHGSLKAPAKGFVPSLSVRYSDKSQFTKDEELGKLQGIEDLPLREFLQQLNTFTKDAMLEFQASPSWANNEPLAKYGGEALLCYQSGECIDERSVVTSSYYNRGELPATLDTGVASYLRNNGIARLASGGKPTGHMPLVTVREGIEILMADSSYSDNSYSEVIIDSRGSWVHGKLDLHHMDVLPTIDKPSWNDPDGTPSTSQMMLDISFRRSEDDLIGRKTPNGWWVQGKVKMFGQYFYHLFHQKGRAMRYRLISRERVLAVLSAQMEVDAEFEDMEDERDGKVNEGKRHETDVTEKKSKLKRKLDEADMKGEVERESPPQMSSDD